MAELKNWSFARSFKEATRLCPEPLAHVDVNIDETCCMLLTLRQTGWSARGVASGASTGSKKDTTTGT
eukprot:6491212-Amphidinium_carterae.1